MIDQDGKFIGFQSPRYTQVPDELFDELLANLSGSELKVLLYVIRRTFGFKRDADHISLSQMVKGIVKKDGTILDNGTGLHKDSVVKAVNSLVNRNILIKARKTSARYGYEPSEYSLNVQNNPLSDNPTRGLGRNNRQGLSEKIDIQKIVLQNKVKTYKNVSNKKIKRIPVDNLLTEREQLIVEDIISICQDEKSRRYYEKIVKKLPEHLIREALSQVRETVQLGKIRISAGAMFTDLIKRVGQFS